MKNMKKMRMMNNPTKFYSDRQEKYISNYLGWDKVTGSGARDFHPGDVKGYSWLGECKTHTQIKPTILIQRKWWHKIITEAIASHKTPVLFVDNGNVKYTWVVTYAIPTNDTSDVFDIGTNINVGFKLNEIDPTKIYKISGWTVGFNTPRLMTLHRFYEEFIV